MRQKIIKCIKDSMDDIHADTFYAMEAILVGILLPLSLLAGCDAAPSDQGGQLRAYNVDVGHNRRVLCIADNTQNGAAVSCKWGE
ncbi:MAG: hypothetical protein LKF93_09630 [Bifidobacterium tibiigranuli]|jgi:hypothetical protein|nr:hypothetical protein [Bifidobacterium tibiigranuli]